MKMKLQAKFNAIDSSIRRNTLINSNIGGWKKDNKNKNEKCPWNFGELGFGEIPKHETNILSNM